MKVIDDRAWRLVCEGVYKGFSIGGRATKRDPQNRKIIKALELREVSLVDRPACPDAVFDCWKATGIKRQQAESQYQPDHVDKALASFFVGGTGPRPAEEPSAAIRKALQEPVGLEPFMIWSHGGKKRSWTKGGKR